MSNESDTLSWFGPSVLDAGVEQGEVVRPQELTRLWRGFMTARATFGLVLLLLQVTIHILGHSQDISLVLLCGGYFASALAVRLLGRPRSLGLSFDLQWVWTIGVDVLVFAALQFLQGSSINYTPLFALPVLQASVLGSLTLALGTAAGATLLMLGNAAWLSWQTTGDAAAPFLQPALTGAGCFVIAYLAHQLAMRLANEEQRTRRSQLAARVQRQVNELVIDALTDGVMVVDVRGTVRAANPAARQLLGTERAIRNNFFELDAEPGWQALAEVVWQSHAANHEQQTDISINHLGQGNCRVRVRTRITASQNSGGESLCVVFMQDQREVEARMRTEKLASMGRMSAAVAHEIRNPLSAIVQANALLEEDLNEPHLKQLTGIVKQNAKRLERIVEDILNISRVQSREEAAPTQTLELNATVKQVCQDWARQTDSLRQLRIQLTPAPLNVYFEPEHMRRILVNLLDNARRYASEHPDAIQVSTRVSADRQIQLEIWSDGAPMEPSVQRHLFEPFFSSESRSSGLGLYICRELCERHGATIAYQRSLRKARGSKMEGNEFFLSLRPTHIDARISSTSPDHGFVSTWPQTPP
jgi:two-component system sensor histidine kinase PilS (NtrC family)